jgi:hypothetical protein
MRNLMILAFAIYGLVLLTAGSLGNTALWIALLVFLGTRGIGQAALCPRLTRRSFSNALSSRRNLTYIARNRVGAVADVVHGVAASRLCCQYCCLEMR